MKESNDVEKLRQLKKDMGYTYAKLGKVVLQQPNHLAIQIVDSKVKHLMLSAYKQASPIVGTSIAELADNLSSELGVDRDRAIRTIEDFNRAAQEGIFNHGILDGTCTKGITPKKSNWAQPLDTPPFLAYPVQCGITFTFGGIEVDKKASRVVDSTGIPIFRLMRRTRQFLRRGADARKS